MYFFENCGFTLVALAMETLPDCSERFGQLRINPRRRIRLFFVWKRSKEKVDPSLRQDDSRWSSRFSFSADELKIMKHIWRFLVGLAASSSNLASSGI
jgi:hypothetical protein